MLSSVGCWKIICQSRSQQYEDARKWLRKPSSSPVRIPRDHETLEHLQIKGLYPCGEGAGFAGGIISAAIDGEKCALKIAESLSK